MQVSLPLLILWMSRCGINTFCLVVDFVDGEWVPQHLIVGIFKVSDMFGVALVEVVKWLLSEFGLTYQVLTYAKDDNINLNMLATNLKFVVKCKPLEIDEPYLGTCFEHVMSNACQYGTNDNIVCVGMTCVSLKDAHVALQKISTWIKKSSKGRIEWDKACVEAWLSAKIVENPNESTIRIQGGFISGNDTYSFHFLFLYFAFHGRILRHCMFLVYGLTT